MSAITYVRCLTKQDTVPDMTLKQNKAIPLQAAMVVVQHAWHARCLSLPNTGIQHPGQDESQCVLVLFRHPRYALDRGRSPAAKWRGERDAFRNRVPG